MGEWPGTCLTSPLLSADLFWGNRKCLLWCVNLLGWGFSESHSPGLWQGGSIPGKEVSLPEVGVVSANKEESNSNISEKILKGFFFFFFEQQCGRKQNSEWVEPMLSQLGSLVCVCFSVLDRSKHHLKHNTHHQAGGGVDPQAPPPVGTYDEDQYNPQKAFPSGGTTPVSG